MNYDETPTQQQSSMSWRKQWEITPRIIFWRRLIGHTVRFRALDDRWVYGNPKRVAQRELELQFSENPYRFGGDWGTDLRP